MVGFGGTLRTSFCRSVSKTGAVKLCDRGVWREVVRLRALSFAHFVDLCVRGACGSSVGVGWNSAYFTWQSVAQRVVREWVDSVASSRDVFTFAFSESEGVQ